jgi:hypothetical protein
MPKECVCCIRGVSEKLGLTPEPSFDQRSKGFAADVGGVFATGTSTYRFAGPR